MSNDQAKAHVCHLQGHLTVPPLCPSSLANLLLQCWAYSPKDRPHFGALLHCLEDLETQKSEFQSIICCPKSPDSSPRSTLHTNDESNSIVYYTEVATDTKQNQDHVMSKSADPSPRPSRLTQIFQNLLHESGLENLSK